MVNDQTAYDMLCLVLKSIREGKEEKPRHFGTVRDIEIRAAKLRDPKLRDELIKQCKELLDAPA